MLAQFAGPQCTNAAAGGLTCVAVSGAETGYHLLMQRTGSAKLGRGERLAAIKRLDDQARLIDQAQGPSFAEYIAAERENAPRYGGQTV